MTHCCAMPTRLSFSSHSNPRLPTAPATAACHLRSPVSSSTRYPRSASTVPLHRSGGPYVKGERSPCTIRRSRFLMYENGGARRRRCKVSMLRNVNVPIMEPNRNGSLPKMACLINAHRKRLQQGGGKYQTVFNVETARTLFERFVSVSKAN